MTYYVYILQSQKDGTIIRRLVITISPLDPSKNCSKMDQITTSQFHSILKITYSMTTFFY